MACIHCMVCIVYILYSKNILYGMYILYGIAKAIMVKQIILYISHLNIEFIDKNKLITYIVFSLFLK